MCVFLLFIGEVSSATSVNVMNDEYKSDDLHLLLPVGLQLNGFRFVGNPISVIFKSEYSVQKSENQRVGDAGDNQTAAPASVDMDEARMEAMMVAAMEEAPEHANAAQSGTSVPIPVPGPIAPGTVQCLKSSTQHGEKLIEWFLRVNTFYLAKVLVVSHVDYTQISET